MSNNENGQVPIPDEPGLLGGWGIKLEITLLRLLLRLHNTIVMPLLDMRDRAIKALFQGIEDELKPVIEPLLDKIDGIDNLPPVVQSMTKHLRFSEPLTFAAIASACIMAGIVGLFLGMIAPFQRLMAQETDSYIHSARMTPSEAFAALQRGAISVTDYHNHLSDGGWSEELEQAWKVILAPLLDVGDLGRLYIRKEITERGFDGELAKRGYQSEEIAKIKTLLHVIPPLSDIITMAVREAFTPEIVQQFQLHAELPVKMVAWAEKQGLSKDWAEAYWASHWQLPSLQMGYEMLHRGEIDQEEMKMLVKAHDVSPFWRDKLIAISYNPYTRVDVRRMFNAGVIGVEEVYQNYRDLGSDHEKATNLTEFTVALSQSKERDLTKTEVLYGFEHAFFSSGETDELLFTMGYDQLESDYYKARVNYKRWQALVKQTVQYVGQQYVAHQIDQTEVYSQLGELNLPSEQMNRYIRGWDLKRQAKTKTLTADRLLKFRVKEIISDTEFTTEMSGLGYSKRYIGWFLDSIPD